MRTCCLPVTLLLLAAPLSAQGLGERTHAPASHLPPSLAPGTDDLAPLAAAARSHPLGTLNNPIRVGGPEGERAYLSRLRCADGRAPRIGGRSPGGTGAYGSVTVERQVGCAAGDRRLVFDLYHEEHVETRAPDGFTLLP